jgi:drug/metabolite transporter (DMT)-like permease
MRAAPAAVACGLATVYIVWGSTYLGIKLAEQTLPPLLMQSTRFVLAGIPLFILATRAKSDPADPIGLRQWRDAAIVGAFLLVGGLGAVTLAERSVPSGIAALLIGMTPLWIVLLERTIHGVRLGRGAVAGVLIGFAGVVVLAWPTGGAALHGVGLALLLWSPISWSLGSLYARRAALPARPLVATAMEMMCASVLLLIAGLLHGEAGHIDPGAVSSRSLLAFGYLVVMGSLVAFSAYVWLLTVAPVSLVATYAYVNPVVAVFLGWLLDGESIGPRVIIAAGVIVAGVVLIVSSHRARSRAQEEPLRRPSGPSQRPKTRQALCPPKPNPFDSA